VIDTVGKELTHRHPRAVGEPISAVGVFPEHLNPRVDGVISSRVLVALPLRLLKQNVAMANPTFETACSSAVLSEKLPPRQPASASATRVAPTASLLNLTLLIGRERDDAWTTYTSHVCMRESFLHDVIATAKAMGPGQGSLDSPPHSYTDGMRTVQVDRSDAPISEIRVGLEGDATTVLARAGMSRASV
jgi:hypothetical protein